MDFFYCGSMQSFLRALSFHSKDIVILSFSGEIIKVCEELGKPFIKLPKFSFWDFMFKPLSILRKANAISKHILPHNFHFSHTQFAVFCFLLVFTYKRKKGTIYFHDFEFYYEPFNRPSLNKSFVKALLYKIIFKLFYNIKLDIKSISNVYMPAISREYIIHQKINVLDEQLTYYKLISEGLTGIQIVSIRKVSVFFTSNLLKNEAFVTKSSLIEAYEIIRKSPSCSLKYHPNVQEVERDYFKEKDSLPDYFPAELLFANIQKYVISVHSAVLIAATHFNHLTSISIMDILIWQNEKTKVNIKNDLIKKSNNKIVFVKSINELKELIK